MSGAELRLLQDLLECSVFDVECVVCRGWGVGFKGPGLGCRVQVVLGCKAQCSVFRV